MNVGDYVRLDRCQGINRIEEYDEDFKKFILEDIIGDEWGDETFQLDENDVIKSSPNIIDLIEVGDVIRFEIETSLETSGILKGITNIEDEEMINKIKEDKNYHIKSIVTKEIFERCEYKL